MLCLRFVVVFSGLLLRGWLGASAQVAISWPAPNTVFQRGATGTATLRLVVCATGTQSLRAVQVRLARYDTAGQRTPIVVNAARASADGWQVATVTAGSGTNRVVCQVEGVPGGLYAVQVRANDSLSREVDLGVGEVFAIAGQSNASGAVNCGELPTQHPRFVQFFNARTTCQDHDPGGKGLPGGSTGCSGPTKNFRFYWGALGDLFAERLGVPVVFYQTAYSGSQVDDWDRGSQGQVTRFGPGVPYASLRAVLTGVVRQTGLRAVLWHQGESDHLTPQYDAALNRVIGRTWADAGFSLPWVVARASYNGGNTSPALVRQQVRVIGYASHANADPEAPVKAYGDPFPGPFGRWGVFSGPFTDSLGAAFRCDNVHFGQNGQQRVAEAWFDAFTRPYTDGLGAGGTFLTNSLPLLPGPAPDGAGCPLPCGTPPPAGTGLTALSAFIRYVLDCPQAAQTAPALVTQVPPGNTGHVTDLTDLRVSPNPGTGRVVVRFTLAGPGPVRLRLVSAAGVELNDWRLDGQGGENQVDLTLGAHPDGLYAVQVTGPDARTRAVRWVKGGH